MALIMGMSAVTVTNANAIWNPFSKCFGHSDIQAEEIMSNASQKLDQAIELTNKTIDTVDKVNNLANGIATNLEATGVIQESTLKVIQEFSKKVSDGTQITGESVYEVAGYKQAISDDLAQLNSIMADGKITKDEALALKSHLPELLEFVDKWDKTGNTKEQIERIKSALEVAAKVSDAVNNTVTESGPSDTPTKDIQSVVVMS